MNLKSIPQPKPSWLTGNLREFKGDAPLAGMVRLAKTYGEAFYLDMFGRRLIFVNSQELVNEICDENRFEKRVHSSLKVLRELVGDGLFTAYTKEDNWAKAHRLLMPAFGPIAVRGMFDQMLDIADQMLVRIERFGPTESFDVAETMTRLTLDTIALCAFDYRFNSFYRDDTHPFVGAMVEALVEAEARGRRPGFVNKLLRGRHRTYESNAQLMQQVADELIAERKRDPNRASKKDLLNIMLEGRDVVTGEGLSDENIRHQLVTFLIAGHETTSGLLSFAIYLLLQNPRVLSKLRQEIDTVLGDELPRVEHLAALRYVEQVLQETLRLWPTAPGFALRPKEDTVIGQRYALTRDDTLMVLIPALHRDPAIWGADAEDFRPERFEPEEAATRPANSWKPFGNGQRACIGRAFAMQEAQLVLAMLVQRFDLELADPAYQLKVAETLTIKPTGLQVRAKRRAHEIKTKAPVASSARALLSATRSTPQNLAPSSVGDIVQDRPLFPLLVLYGSNSGSSETFAKRIVAQAQDHGYAATLSTLDQAIEVLPQARAVVVFTASYEGQPTDNARQFVQWLRNTSPGALAGVPYAVFGCGNRQWARTYQAIPKEVDTRLEAMGAVRFKSRGEADASGDFFGGFDEWAHDFWSALGAATGRKVQAPTKSAVQLKVEAVVQDRTVVLQEPALRQGQILENRELVVLQSDIGRQIGRSKRHLDIRLPTGMRYQCGDYLSVLPLNPPDVVARALRRFGFDADSTVVIRQASGGFTSLPVDTPVQVSQLLAGYVELSQPATRAQVAQLAASTRCPPEQKPLLLLAEESSYKSDVLAKRLSVLDLLERYLSCELDFAAYLAMLPALKSRQYSISSSPLWDEARCTLSVAVVDAPALSGQGRYQGVGSTHLARTQAGDKVWISVLPSKGHFRLPADPMTPIVMVCAGTGLAPFRGFVQERAMQKAKGQPVGPALLFFGCDHPDVDWLHKDELAQWQAEGVVQVRTAFSASPQGDVRFVQHRLWQDRQDVMPMLSQGAHVYVCGDGLHMAPAVRDTVVRMYADSAAVGMDEAHAWVEQFLAQTGRYAEDVFS
mgnify:CR=1 FL=1